MSEAKNPDSRVPKSEEDLEDFVASVDTGGRKIFGTVGFGLALVALSWSLFQLWIASPLPYMVIKVVPLLNDTHTRSIHLAFAVFLAFTSFPALKGSPRDRIPVLDWLLAFAGAAGAAYIAVAARGLAERPGLPTTTDLVFAGLGMVFLLEATRRALGLPLMLVAILFLCYVFFGHLAPEVISWQGASFGKAMSHLWLYQEGVFGIGLGVSTTFVFLFVLFGALLDKAGAGNYFTMVAFSLLGHLRGGPAKAAVVSSAMNGMISGSSIANVVVTGTFTIPLMKKVGFSSEKAGAIEVASSTNGQLTPPIMGAAAFLMIEYVGITYIEVIKHAFLPAVISYIALFYIVHLEAMKAGMVGLPRRHISPLMRRLLSYAIVACGIVILSAFIYYGFSWVKTVFGDASILIAAITCGVAYVVLVAISARVPDLIHDVDALIVLPDVKPTLLSGLHFLLPVVVLIWCLVVERFSPGLSAFWASILMAFIVVTQHSLKAALRKEGRELADGILHGLSDLYHGLVSGARNMIGIGLATAVAGIVVGTVTLTGIGLVLTEFVELISGGNVMLMLIFTAVISLLLGMGLPTTANYIVVSTLMAPVIVALGAKSGLIVPLIAVHMFVFYFGILADDTPPVGLAAFAAAGISGGDPIKTGLQGFAYDIRTAILPFMFIFNTQLLLIGIGNWFELGLVVITAVIAMLAFAAATQGYFIVKSRKWESLALVLVAFTLFRPGFFWDMVFPPTQTMDPAAIVEIAEAQAPDGKLRITVEGETIDGKYESKVVELPLGAAAAGNDRLIESGIEIREEEGRVFIDNIIFGSYAQEKGGLDFDWEITVIELPSDRLPKQLMFFPALGLLGFIIAIQRRRRPQLGMAEA